MAIKAAQDKWEREIRVQAVQAISGKDSLRNNMIGVLVKKTDFEVVKIDAFENSATVTVQVQSVPTQVRSALMEIVQKVDERKTEAFNVSDAIGLISQQLNISSGTHADVIYKFEFIHGSKWTLIEK